MANLQKFAKGNVKGLSIHLDRKTTNHSNKEMAIGFNPLMKYKKVVKNMVGFMRST